MKKYFIIIMFGLCANSAANQAQNSKAEANAPLLTSPEAETDKPERNGLALNSATITAGVKPKRNGFAALRLRAVYNIGANKLFPGFSTGYGVVLGKIGFADAGLFEGLANVSGFSSESIWALDFSFRAETNFIKNDGANILIPGLSLGAGLRLFDKFGNEFENEISTRLGFYIKIFVSKQFAFVPMLEAGTYTYGNSIVHSPGHEVQVQSVGPPTKTTILRLGLSLGLRQYF